MQKHILLAFSLLALSPISAIAQDTSATASTLTDKSIRAFYQKSIEAYKSDYPSYYKFMDESLTSDSVCTTVSRITAPGRTEPLTQKETQNKAQLLASARQVYDSMKGSSLSNNVISITIAADGKTAEVKDETRVDGMNMTGIKASVHGICDDTLVLSNDNIIQIAKSSCTSEVSVIPAQ